jgi:hypothetical protein
MTSARFGGQFTDDRQHDRSDRFAVVPLLSDGAAANCEGRL